MLRQACHVRDAKSSLRHDTLVSRRMWDSRPLLRLSPRIMWKQVKDLSDLTGLGPDVIALAMHEAFQGGKVLPLVELRRRQKTRLGAAT